MGAIVVAAVAWSAAPASAHNYPVAYSPAEGATVTEQPAVFSVTTNDNLLDLDQAGSGMAMQITGPAGGAAPLYYGDGCITVFGPTVETTAQLGDPGEYTVIWQVVSTDGHPVSGEFTFTWQPAAGQQLAEGSATPSNCGRSGESQPSPGVATDDAGSAASAPTGAELTDALWIGGAVLAVLLAVGGTLLLVRRKPSPPTE